MSAELLGCLWAECDADMIAYLTATIERLGLACPLPGPAPRYLVPSILPARAEHAEPPTTVAATSSPPATLSPTHTGPTPSGVPVRMQSPASRVMIVEINAISLGTSCIMSAVLPRCRCVRSPLE